MEFESIAALELTEPKKEEIRKPRTQREICLGRIANVNNAILVLERSAITGSDLSREELVKELTVTHKLFKDACTKLTAKVY